MLQIPYKYRLETCGQTYGQGYLLKTDTLNLKLFKS